MTLRPAAKSRSSGRRRLPQPRPRRRQGLGGPGQGPLSYRPAKGVGGIYSLADETLLPDLPEGARVVSPYVVPSGDEGQAIRSGAGGTSASVLHGWAGAKALAAAIWRTGADTPAGVQSALEGLAGWSSGLAPPYETRPGTRSRTPEGVLFQVQSGAFVAEGGFRRDPY